jgi:betaine-aldehyde dehydrogenase
VFDNAGQDCCARSRILVQRSAVDDFLSALKPAVEAITVGDPMAEGTEMGPLISRGQRDSVSAFVCDESTIAIQGAVPDGPGFWFPPTVLHQLPRDHAAVCDEIFGPVAVIIPFDDEEDAIRQANDTIYGLSGSIWTGSGARALRMARAVQAGNLSVNSNSSVRVTTPFGGFKQSGYGRELGPHATDAYTEVKTVFIDTTG